ncbi:hypothetical protein [Serratia nevei]|uniref:hypothetical protein n=1 Tax=Serratia nevei TaxID=2703794 RepID=UPI00301AC7D9
MTISRRDNRLAVVAIFIFSPLREGLSFIELLQQIAGNLQLVAFGAELLRFVGSFLRAISLE